jgi:hypothetical protein
MICTAIRFSKWQQDFCFWNLKRDFESRQSEDTFREIQRTVSILIFLFILLLQILGSPLSVSYLSRLQVLLKLWTG